MAGPKPTLAEFGIHHRFETCGLFMILNWITNQICPVVEPETYLEAALIEAAAEAGAGLTPSALKSLSRSVADLSSISPDLMTSTADLMTGKVFKGEKFKRKMAKLKSGSQQTLITDHSQQSSVEDIPGYLFDVRI